MADQRAKGGDSVQQDLIIDTFLTESIGTKHRWIYFWQASQDLSESDRQLVSNWRHSFIGILPLLKFSLDGFELMNWLTAKHYIVASNDAQTLEEMTV